MNSLKSRIAVRLVSAALLSLMIAGCQIQTGGPSSISDGNSQPNGQADGNSTPTDSPQQTINKSKTNGESPVIHVSGDNEKSEADAKTESTTLKNTASESNAEKKWDPQAPMLRQIAVLDLQSDLDKSLGKPAESYTFEDGGDQLTVHEYSGYSIGFGQNKKVKFIEVFDSKASTGLNGLRVGDPEKSALNLLGKPDTHTASVLAYKAKDALLKLDLDPENNKIISIKLFADS
ncbi:hypothetical protein [Paenibacillus nasutitermitis]|uniref:DUF4309 domain-containing protein n=1 Tax=Paenibacillus nasutitermitis TaxID=1652958 RepID=A0A916YQK7_9BACL|nr:hypothetical protein [Paenibacillus nasutitermitis]GGD56016.1 hypothetical protein GCM10010911_12140 [Paenibacillus nasutitermitis]